MFHIHFGISETSPASHRYTPPSLRMQEWYPELAESVPQHQPADNPVRPVETHPWSNFSIPPRPAQPATRRQTPLYTWAGPAFGRLRAPDQTVTTDSNGLHVERRWGGTPVLDASNGDLPHGWMRFAHFDGSVYYYNTIRCIATPDDITQPEILKKYRIYTNNVMRRLVMHPPYAEFVSGWQTLVVKNLASAEVPTIFSLDYSRGSYIELLATAPEDESAPTPVRVECLTANFWNALRDFPMHLTRAPPLIDADFVGALSFVASERILEWNDTAYPFTDDQIRRLVQIYKDLKYDLERGLPVVPAFTYHIARTMSSIEEVRQRVHFGTYDFQLYRKVVSERVDWKVKLADACLVWVLFGVHRNYRKRLQSARVKGEVYLTDFKELMKSFLAEWSDSNLLATVFVGANIAFLAVPGISHLQQTASLASTIFSVLSVATGVYHVWHHRTKVDASLEDAQSYMNCGSTPHPRDADLALTACVLSIPLVALFYSVLAFAVALGAFCIQNSTSDIHARVLLSVVLAILGTSGLATLLFFWNAWRGPRTEEVSEEDSRDVIDYGWRTKAQAVANSVMSQIRRRCSKEDKERKDEEVASQVA